MMAWTPADGPSREDIRELMDLNFPDGWPRQTIIDAVVAAHDLHEENQRLQAEIEGIKVVLARLDDFNCTCAKQLAEAKVNLALSDEALAACQAQAAGKIRTLEAALAEAKRNAERDQNGTGAVE